MTKTKRAAKQKAPNLAASLRWFKAEIRRNLNAQIADVASPCIAAAYRKKLFALNATKLADLKAQYIAHRSAEICSGRMFELKRMTRNPIVVVRAWL